MVKVKYIIYGISLFLSAACHAKDVSSYLCENTNPSVGISSFKGYGQILIRVAGNDVDVFAVDSGKVFKDQQWSYYLNGEDADIGIQAIRKGGDFLVYTGGMLFVTWKNNNTYAYVTSSYVPYAEPTKSTTNTELLKCKQIDFK